MNHILRLEKAILIPGKKSGLNIPNDFKYSIKITAPLWWPWPLFIFFIISPLVLLHTKTVCRIFVRWSPSNAFWMIEIVYLIVALSDYLSNRYLFRQFCKNRLGRIQTLLAGSRQRAKKQKSVSSSLFCLGQNKNNSCELTASSWFRLFLYFK